jgi:hypothetical protein
MGMTTVQEILKKAFKGYEETHSLPVHVHKAAKALIQCRTADLGGHVQACPEGHYHRQWYNSCRNRICPQCNWIRIEQWLERQEGRLLACGHYHIIFTIPHELSDIWLTNVKHMTNLLFSCVRETLYEFFLDIRHVGGKPGIIATLHTWSQTMILHPHIHCLVTEGGLNNDQWMSTRQKGYLLPIRAVMALFRGKFLASLDTAIQKELITLPSDMTLTQWKNLKNKLGRVKWNVHIRERYDHGKGILIYLSRYLRGGAMSNKRIISHTEKGVAFSYKNSDRSQRESMLLPVTQFIQRYLLHVPYPYTKVVRYYGIYAPAAKDVLSFCRSLFRQEGIHEPNVIDWQTSCETKGEDHPERCPVCGCRLIRMMDIPRIPRPANREAILNAA